MLTLLQANVGNESQDRIGIVPMMLVDAGFNMLAAFLAFMLIRVSLQSAHPAAEINELEAQEAATL